MRAERVIEVTIGLWDEDVPKGENPPRLANAIVKALLDAGYEIVQHVHTDRSCCAPHEHHVMPHRGGGCILR